MSNPFLDKLSVEELRALDAQLDGESNDPSLEERYKDAPDRKDPYSFLDNLAKEERQSKEYWDSFKSPKGLGKKAYKLGRGAVNAIPDLAGLPTNLYRMATGRKPVRTPVRKAFDWAETLVTGQPIRPQSPQEQTEDDFLEGVGGMAGGAPLGKAIGLAGKALGNANRASKVQKIGQAITQSGTDPRALLTGGLGNVASRPILENTHPAVGLPLSMLATAGIGSGVNAISKSHPMARLAGKVAGFDPEKMKSFTAGRMNPTLADVTKRDSLRNYQNKAFHSNPAKKLGKRYDALESDVAKLFPDGTNPEQAAAISEEAAKTFQKYHKDLGKEKYRAAYDPLLDAGLNQFEPKRAKEFLDKIERQAVREGTPKNKIFGSEALQQIVKKIRGDDLPESLKGLDLKSLSPRARQQVEAQLGSGKNALTFGEVNAAKHGLFDRLKKISKGYDNRTGVTNEEGIAKALSGALKDDMKTAGVNVPEDVAKQFQKKIGDADTNWRRFKRDEKVLDPVLNPVMTPEKKLSKIASDFKDGGNMFQNLMKHLPAKDQKKLFNRVVNNMAKRDGAPSPNHFGKILNNVSEPQQKWFLETNKRLNDVDPTQFKGAMNAFQDVKKRKGAINTSGTSIYEEMYRKGKAVREAATDVSSGKFKKAWAALQNALMYIPSALVSKGAQNIMASKSVLNFLNKPYQIKKPGQVPIFLNKLDKLGVPENKIKALKAGWIAGMKGYRGNQRFQDLNPMGAEPRISSSLQSVSRELQKDRTENFDYLHKD